MLLHQISIMQNKAPADARRTTSVSKSAEDALDRLLIADYDPCTSAAWAGAAPWHLSLGIKPTFNQLAFDLLPSLDPSDSSCDPDHAVFIKNGFSVRLIEGKGKATVLDEFVSRHHHSLRGGGMSGRTYGLYDPTAVLVGVIIFARPTNAKTAAGMQVVEIGDDLLSPTEMAHLTHGEAETLDCTRLCVADVTPSGFVLGTGAESFLFAAALRDLASRNRSLWRVTRMVEMGIPLTPAACRILASVSSCKCVRSFATVGTRGVSYAASGLFYCGRGRSEQESVGRRSAELCGRRSLSKLESLHCHGHDHQVLRAVWEGSEGYLTAFDSGGNVITSIDLSPIRAMVGDDLTPLVRQRALKRAYYELRADAECGIAGEAVMWSLSADRAGYVLRHASPKHRYVGYLGAPYYVVEMARRSKYLRESILAAERAWFAPARRWPRGLGFGWKRRPQRLGIPQMPRS